jgi:hypothetical protein
MMTEEKNTPYYIDVGDKFDDGKPRLDLVPYSTIQALARVLGFGAKKYGDWNWTKGLSWSRPFSALLRHLWAWFWGEDIDPESKLHHLDHVLANACFLRHYTEHNIGTDNRPTHGISQKKATPEPYKYQK